MAKMKRKIVTETECDACERCGVRPADVEVTLAATPLADNPTMEVLAGELDYTGKQCLACATVGSTRVRSKVARPRKGVPGEVTP
jgi:hypothetical protein